MRVGVTAEGCIHSAFKCKSSLLITVAKKDWNRVNLNSDWCNAFFVRKKWSKKIFQLTTFEEGWWLHLPKHPSATVQSCSLQPSEECMAPPMGPNIRALIMCMLRSHKSLNACLIVSPVVLQCALLAPRQLWPPWVPGQCSETVVCNRHSLGSQSSEAWNLRIPLYASYTKHCHFRKVDWWFYAFPFKQSNYMRVV